MNFKGFVQGFQYFLRYFRPIGQQKERVQASNLKAFFTTINIFVKSSLLDVEGVSGYDDSYHQPLDTVHMCGH